MLSVSVKVGVSVKTRDTSDEHTHVMEAQSRPTTPDWLMVAAEQMVRPIISSDARLLNFLKLMAAYNTHPMGDDILRRVRLIQESGRERQRRTKWASTRLQSAARGHAARNALACARKAATTIQAVWRGRAEAKHIRHLRDAFSERSKIQLMARAQAERWRADGEKIRADREKIRADRENIQLAHCKSQLSDFVDTSLLVGKTVRIIFGDDTASSPRSAMAMGQDGDCYQVGLISAREQHGKPGWNGEHSFKIVKAKGHRTFALHNAAANRFVRIRGGKIDGMGGIKADCDLPDHWLAERFVIVPTGGGRIAFFNCHAGKFIGHLELGRFPPGTTTKAMHETTDLYGHAQCKLTVIG